MLLVAVVVLGAGLALLGGTVLAMLLLGTTVHVHRRVLVVAVLAVVLTAHSVATLLLLLRARVHARVHLVAN